MSVQNEVLVSDSNSDNEGELRHEINYLRGRLSNLEAFKRLFFELKKKQNPTAIEKNSLDPVDVVLSDCLIDFMHESSSVVNYQDLIMLVFHALSENGMDISVQLHCAEGELSYRPGDHCSEEDLKQFSKMKNKGSIVEGEDELCVNYEYVSLLVKHWPYDNAAKSDEIKTQLIVFGEVINDRIKSIEDLLSSRLEIEHLHQIIDSTHEVLTEIETAFGKKIEKIDSLQARIMEKALIVITKLRLNEKKSKNVLSLLTSCMKKQSESLFSSLELNERLNGITSDLSSTKNTMDKRQDTSVRGHKPSYH